MSTEEIFENIRGLIADQLGLEEENIPYIPAIFMHDELDFHVPEEHAERAKELGIKAFQEGPKLFGVEIMDGDGKVGLNWMDVH